MNSRKYLILLADEASTSFCYYENPSFRSAAAKPMTRAVYSRALAYARENDLAVNVLTGRERLPREFERALEKTDHAKLVPLRLRNVYAEAVYVVNPSDISALGKLPTGAGATVILRLAKKDLAKLAAVITVLFESCARVNLCLLELESYSDENLALYHKQLQRIAELTAKRYAENKQVELGFLSDRLVLKSMRNCDAGLSHVTVAPDGRFYLCPAFYYDRIAEPAGTLKAGIAIRNAHLLDLEHAPICSRCDAFHCRRCIYLNKKLTLEINTPSHQQCVASHMERNAARDIGQAITPLLQADQISEIPLLSYLDPLEHAREQNSRMLLHDPAPHTAGAVPMPPLGMPVPTRDLSTQPQDRPASPMPGFDLTRMSTQEIIEISLSLQTELKRRITAAERKG